MARAAVDNKTDFSKAPQPSVDRIEELASRILSGDILLPKFQRDFVWKKSQILELWDSIAKNYPVGSVLLWRSREKLQSERSLADLAIAGTKEDYPVNYLLDGQQRLSTVCGALYWSGTDEKSRWNIAYDLRLKRFFHLDTLDSPPNHQVRVNWLPDPSKFFTQMARVSSESDAEALRAAGKDLFDRFKDYKIATVTLLDMPMNDVGPIFERINSRGTPLTVVDLMRAATWSESFDLIDSIEDILRSVEEKNFETIDRKAVLRNLSASAEGGFADSSIDNLRKFDISQLTTASVKTKDAYKLAIDFLATDLSIPSSRHVPYVNQIVVLVEVFRLLPAPSSMQRLVLKQWFWKTAVNEYFAGWNTADMANDQRAAAQFANGDMESLNYGISNPKTNLWQDQQYRQNTALSKILTLLLAFNAPVDLLTGQTIDSNRALHQANNKEFHHFFPRDFLLGKGVDPRRANALGNFVMLTAASNKKITNRAPSSYLKDAAAQLGATFKVALETNLVSDGAYAAALEDDYDLFLAERSRTISKRIDELTGW